MCKFTKPYLRSPIFIFLIFVFVASQCSSKVSKLPDHFSSFFVFLNLILNILNNNQVHLKFGFLTCSKHNKGMQISKNRSTNFDLYVVATTFNVKVLVSMNATVLVFQVYIFPNPPHTCMVKIKQFRYKTKNLKILSALV